jgi:hypothetical protein
MRYSDSTSRTDGRAKKDHASNPSRTFRNWYSSLLFAEPTRWSWH